MALVLPPIFVGWWVHCVAKEPDFNLSFARSAMDLSNPSLSRHVGTSFVSGSTIF